RERVAQSSKARLSRVRGCPSRQAGTPTPIRTISRARPSGGRESLWSRGDLENVIAKRATKRASAALARVELDPAEAGPAFGADDVTLFHGGKYDPGR